VTITTNHTGIRGRKDLKRSGGRKKGGGGTSRKGKRDFNQLASTQKKTKTEEREVPACSGLVQKHDARYIMNQLTTIKGRSKKRKEFGEGGYEKEDARLWRFFSPQEREQTLQRQIQ